MRDSKMRSLPDLIGGVSRGELSRLVPPLSRSATKGTAGKIAVVGGCAEYTGAPFYAALSALKLGADLAHIFCEADAALPIKSYSPEIIVHGYMHANMSVDEAAVDEQARSITRWFPTLTALIVGPGLGRDETLRAVAAKVLDEALNFGLPCVIDADGIRLVQERPSLVKDRSWAVLTPNVVEFGRLADAMNVENVQKADEPDDVHQRNVVSRLSFQLDGPIVLRKGREDLISSRYLGNWKVGIEDEEGSLKRSGGQGDVLAGILATFLSWSKSDTLKTEIRTNEPPRQVLSAIAASYITRRASAHAFFEHRRSMTAPDVINEIGKCIEEFAPTNIVHSEPQ